MLRRLPLPRKSSLFLAGAGALAVSACAPARAPDSAQANEPAAHGTISSMSAARSADAAFCEHEVPAENCTRCHPGLAAKFKEVGDWCGEHDRPESQCLICHPDLTFAPLPTLAETADVKTISAKGEDVPSLEAHLVPGKVTVFDFYADWCAPCREVDAYMFGVVNERNDVALRKLNVVGWDSAVAKRYMKKVPKLPYLLVYGADGKLVGPVVGLDLKALEEAIREGAAQ